MIENRRKSIWLDNFKIINRQTPKPDVKTIPLTHGLQHRSIVESIDYYDDGWCMMYDVWCIEIGVVHDIKKKIVLIVNISFPCLRVVWGSEQYNSFPPSPLFARSLKKPTMQRYFYSLIIHSTISRHWVVFTYEARGISTAINIQAISTVSPTANRGEPWGCRLQEPPEAHPSPWSHLTLSTLGPDPAHKVQKYLFNMSMESSAGTAGG